MKKNLKSGMTLVEVLIASTIASLIMISIFTAVSFTTKTFTETTDIVETSKSKYDAINVLNRFIRESKFCSIQNNEVILAIPRSMLGQYGEQLINIRITNDPESKILYIDPVISEMNKIIIAKNITRMEYSIVNNGIEYTAFKTNSEGDEEIDFNGFSFCRTQ